jgi:hypothetical protein
MPAGSARFMFQWLALWPLIALSLEADHAAGIAAAAGYARRLLHPSQQRLPDPLVAPLEQAVRQWEAGDPAAAVTHLRRAAALARQAGCL